jgi:hypothetical protein
MILGSVVLGGVGVIVLSVIGGQSYHASDAVWQSVFAYLLAKALRAKPPNRMAG